MDRLPQRFEPIRRQEQRGFGFIVERAKAAGLMVIVDKCVKMEHGRYGGGLHFAGMNTEIISARKRKR